MLKGYRTIIVNTAGVLFMAIMLIFPGADLPSPEEIGEVVDSLDQLLLQATAIGVGVTAFVNQILRAFTTTPIFKKDNPDA